MCCIVWLSNIKMCRIEWLSNLLIDALPRRLGVLELLDLLGIPRRELIHLRTAARFRV